MCIILSVIAIVLLFTTNIQFKVIIFDLNSTIVKIIYTINLVMTIILSLCLTIGAIRKNILLMLPWVVLGVLILIALLFSVIFTSVAYFIEKKEVHHVLYGVLALLFGLLAFVICTYFWIVTYSYFQQLRQEKNSLKIGPYGRPYSYQRP
ncbi:uncharacterized protein LOC100116794 isoform X2 [Nasonia vitripennis]|nr:uncharacterized protein LOC100116794 isoform X2 [Nasonia vitripennis]